jgi:hypothetical protein
MRIIAIKKKLNCHEGVNYRAEAAFNHAQSHTSTPTVLPDVSLRKQKAFHLVHLIYLFAYTEHGSLPCISFILGAYVQSRISLYTD